MISMDWSIPGRLRREVCYRADKITGPYEKRVILETEFDGHGGVGQGCIVDGKNGEWYGLIFQDRGGVGRVPCLMPCTWTEDGWPMLGDKDGHIPNVPLYRICQWMVSAVRMIFPLPGFPSIGSGIITPSIRHGVLPTVPDFCV